VKTCNVKTSNLTFFNKNVTSCVASSSRLTFSHSTFLLLTDVMTNCQKPWFENLNFDNFTPTPPSTDLAPQSLFSQNELACVRVWGLIVQICNFLKTISKIRFCLKLICLGLRLNLHGFDLFPTVVYFVANFSPRDSNGIAPNIYTRFSLKHSNIPLSEIKDFVLSTCDEMVIDKLVLVDLGLQTRKKVLMIWRQLVWSRYK
jgi:hypothetical protein